MAKPTIYRIDTDRLMLRCWDPKDAPLLDKAVQQSVEHLMLWLPWAHEEPQQLSDRVDLLRRFRGKFDLGEMFIFGVFNPEGSEVRGGSGLHLRAGGRVQEIGYWIRTDHLRKGYASEISAALTKVAFDYYDVRRVEIRCDPENTASAGIPKKLGYLQEGVLRHRDEFLGAPRDTQVWGLAAEEYRVEALPGTRLRAYAVLGNRVMVAD